jgi:hypothetical protein
MATKKRGVPTPAELKRLAKAHTKAEDALRHAELRAMVAKKTTTSKRR